MSLVQLANVSAHLSNCSRARLTLTSVPYTKLHLNVALNLYKHGFISSLQRGSTIGPDVTNVEVTPDNIATRRLWVGLKYRDNKPIMSQFKLVSKPNQRVFLKPDELRLLCSGVTIRQIKPLQPGEIVLVRTSGDKQILEVNECVKKNLGGEVLCRVK